MDQNHEEFIGERLAAIEILSAVAQVADVGPDCELSCRPAFKDRNP